MRALILITLVIACSKAAPEQKPAEQRGDPQPASESKPAPVAGESELVKFCAQCYFKVMDCIKDAEFWQVFSTMYFANTKLTSDETEREHWIGVMKEDLLKLYSEHGFEKGTLGAEGTKQGDLVDPGLDGDEAGGGAAKPVLRVDTGGCLEDAFA